MKNVLSLLISTAISVLGTGVASASSFTTGKVTFIGTYYEDSSGGVYSARLRVRVHGTCDNDYSTQDRWVVIKSGRTDGIFAHNGVNMKNAYSTLTSALLSGKSVLLEGLSNCSVGPVIPMDLWNGTVGLTF